MTPDPVEGPYDGMATSILSAVEAALDAPAAKAALGLKYVRVGEQLRGWTPPAAFVFLGAPGAPRGSETRRRGVYSHLVHVDVVIVSKRNAQRSLDVEVLDTCGKLPGVLYAAMPLGRSRHMEVLNAGEVGLFLDRKTGEYETEGRVQLVFEAEAELPRPGAG